MANEKNSNRPRFFYRNDEFENSPLQAASVVQPRMLPPFFRERTRWLQKIYVFIIIVAMALVVGVTAYVMVNDFSQKYQLTSSNQSTHLIYSLVLGYVAIAATAFFVWWSRNRAYIINATSVVAIIIPPIVLAVVLLVYYSRVDVTTAISEPRDLFLVIAIAMLAATIVAALIVTIFNVARSKSFREAKFRSFFTWPGLVVIAAAPLVLWAVSNGNVFNTFDTGEIIFPLLPLFGGVALIGLGVVLSNRYKPQEVQLASRSVQISSSLSSIVVFLTLFILGLSFAGSGQFTTPIIAALVIDFLVVLAFGLFIFFRGRIKNIVTTNPLFNELVVKSSIVLIAITGLIFVAATPELILVKSYAPTTFGLVALTGGACFIVVSMAHFANLVVFEKFAKTLFIGSALSLIAILIVVFVIGSLQSAQIFINLFAMGIAISVIVAPLIIECIVLLVAILTIETDVVRNQNWLRRQARAQKAAPVETSANQPSNLPIRSSKK